MPNDEEIQQQQQLLVTQRELLAAHLSQKSINGATPAESEVLQEIITTRLQIAYIKGILRNWNVVVEDQPIDEDQMLAANADRMAPPIIQSSRSPQPAQEFVERGQSFSQGMHALRDLMMRIPEARDTLMACRADIQATCDHIEELDTYKALHDLLHDLQFLCFNCIEQEARRFPSDDMAIDNLQRYELNFEQTVSGLQDVASHSFLGESKVAWIQDLVAAHQEFCDAIEHVDDKQLQKAIRRVKRVLTLQPSLLNTQLNDAARALRLPALMQALTRIHNTFSHSEAIALGEIAPVEQLSQEQVNATVLRQSLITFFNDGELRSLCADLAIEYENLPGQGKEDKARELIAYAERRGRTVELVESCRRLRPRVDWNNAGEIIAPERLRPGLDPEKVQQFEAGVAALTSLNHDLALLIDEHDQWQVIDCILRRIEDRLEQDLDELEWSWPDLKVKCERLYGACTEKWALALKADGEKLESAITASDQSKIKQSWLRYRSQAGNRFYRIDNTLKKLCDELRQIDGPLFFVLRILE